MDAFWLIEIIFDTILWIGESLNPWSGPSMYWHPFRDHAERKRKRNT